MYFLIYCGFLNVETISFLKKFSENRIAHNITIIEEPSSLSTVEISSSSQWTESDLQTSRTMHINEEKSTNKNNKSIPVQCQPGPDYPFTMKHFGKKKRFKNFFWLHYSKEKDSVFCIFCIRHKGKLTAEHNMEEAYITKGFNNWKKALEAFLIYNNLMHIALQLYMNP